MPYICTMKSIVYVSRRVMVAAVAISCLGLVPWLASCSSHKKNVVSREKYIVRSRGESGQRKAPGGAIGQGDPVPSTDLLREAYTWIGTPYGYGRSERGVASDCSGMVLEVFRTVAGVKLPRNSAEQAAFCEPLDPDEVQEGDLVFFATGRDPERISHVGIMVDATHFIHASTAKGVVVSDATTPYYRRTFIKFGRVPGAVIQRNGRGRREGRR